MSLTGSAAEWLERHARKRGIAGSIQCGGIYFHIDCFRLFPVAHSAAKTTQLKSSKARVQDQVHSNWYKKIDLILKNMAAVNMMTCQL